MPLTELIDTTTPVATAFILGLVNAVSHCLLATNIAAICFISQDLTNKRKIFFNGLFYTAGRTVSYTLLAILLTYLLHRGIDTIVIREWAEHYGDVLIGPLFLLLGIVLFVSDKLRIPLPGFNINKQLEQKAKQGYWGSFILGFVLALAFCPTSAFIFFGMLIPLSAGSEEGILLPITFAIATGIPVIAASWILAFSYEKLNRFYNHIQLTGKWLKYIVSLLFIVVGLYFLFFHHHTH